MNPTSPLQSAASALLRNSGLKVRTLAFQEGQNGGTTTKFLQDTGSAWLPKILISRSMAEGTEASLLEFAESAMTYALPSFLGPILGNAFSRFGGKAGKLNKGLLTSTYEALREKAQNKALEIKVLDRTMAAKAAVIISTVGLIGFWGESLINYGKNLMTAKVFKKYKFSDVVNLNQGAPASPINYEESQQVQKAKRRIKQATMEMGGILAGSGLMAAFGHRIPLIRDLTHKIVKWADFEFATNTNGKVAYGLGSKKGLLGAIMLTCSIPYLDSARDRYERLETILRLPIVFAYILFGQDFIQQKLISSRLTSGWFKSALDDKGQLKSMQAIAEEALHKVTKGDAQTLANPSQEVLRLARHEMKSAVKAKGLAFGLPLLSGIMITGLGLGLFNRALTAFRFKQQNKRNAFNLTPPPGTLFARPVESYPPIPSSPLLMMPTMPAVNTLFSSATPLALAQAPNVYNLRQNASFPAYAVPTSQAALSGVRAAGPLYMPQNTISQAEQA